MIFWILIGITAALVAFTLWMAVTERDWYLVGSALAIAAIGPIVTLLAVGLSMLIASALDTPGEVGKLADRYTVDLRAVNTGPSLSGSFFLGSGTIDGERTFSYVYEEGDWTRLGQVDADDSRVAEDATPETAHMIATTTDYFTWWIAPWNLWHDTRYDFHVPSDSVIESYEISAK